MLKNKEKQPGDHKTIPPIEVSIALASQLHLGQHDKIGEPYVLHPIRVMLAMCTLVERTVAILHDVIEDTGETAEGLIKRGYPKRIVQAIEAMSKRKGEDYMQFMARVSNDPIALKVKLADIRDNMSPIRQYSLPPEHRGRLVDKYMKAIKYLQDREAELL